MNNLLSEFRASLEEGIIPFWLQRGWDNDFGGFLTNFDENGHELPTPEKYLNTQARMIWWFSTLSRHYPDRDDYQGPGNQRCRFPDQPFLGYRIWRVVLEIAEETAHAWMTGKSSTVKVSPSTPWLNTIALPQDNRGLQYASDTFDLLQVYCADTLRGGYYENLEQDWSLAQAGFYGGDRKGLDTHMHLMEAFTTLYAASGKAYSQTQTYGSAGSHCPENDRSTERMRAQPV